MGRTKFGEPDERVLTAIEALTDLVHLRSLLLRILDVSSWNELLATSPAGDDVPGVVPAPALRLPSSPVGNVQE